MKKVILLLLFTFLSGCATVNYMPYDNIDRPPKPSNCPILTENSLSSHTCKVIGNLSVVGSCSYLFTTSEQDVAKEFFKAARSKGADGARAIERESTPSYGILYFPESTTYDTVTTYHQGNVSGNVSGNAYDGSYTGTSSTRIPTHHPAQTIPFTRMCHSMSGELVIFTTDPNDL